MLAGGVAVDQGVGGDVFGDDCSCADQGMLADGHSANDRRVGSDACSAFDQRFAEGVCGVAREGRTGHGHVGEDNRRATKDVVFQGDAFVDGDVVLNFDVVTDINPGADDDVLSNAAPLSDIRAGDNMAEMPDPGVFPDGHAIVDVAGFVNGIVRSRL